MSLEEALDRNTAAIEKHTAVLEAFVKQASAGKAAAATTTTTAPKSEPVKGDKPATGKGKPGPKPKAAAAPKGPMSAQDMKAVCKAYLEIDDDEAGRTARREFLVAVMQHLGVKSSTEIAEDDRPRVRAWIDQKQANPEADVNFEADEGGTEEAGDGESDLLG